MVTEDGSYNLSNQIIKEVKDIENAFAYKRKIIVNLAKKIVSQHKDQKIATYNQVPRTVNFDKPVRWRGTHYGMRNPIVYDCTSFVSCCYLKAGLHSVYDKRASAGTLVKSATSKEGWKMWKLTTENLDKYAKPGDIIMVSFVGSITFGATTLQPVIRPITS